MWGALVGIGLSMYSTYTASKEKKETGKDAARNAKEAAKWNSKLSLYDAKVMDEQTKELQYQTGVELQQHASMIDKILGTQKASYAYSGVAGGTGSALDVSAATARAGAMDADTIRYEGAKAAKYASKMAERYRLLSKAGLREAANYASAIIDTSKAQSNAILISGLATTTSKTYDLGSKQGWWD